MGQSYSKDPSDHNDFQDGLNQTPLPEQTSQMSPAATGGSNSLACESSSVAMHDGAGTSDWPKSPRTLVVTRCNVGVCGCLADGYHSSRRIGGTPKPVTVLGRDRWKAASSWDAHAAVHPSAHRRGGFPWRKASWGTQVGKMDGPPRGGGGWASPAAPDPEARDRPWRAVPSQTTNCSGPPSGGPRRWARRPPTPGMAAATAHGGVKDSYLVDSASSHMLVSKIKPCMSKYKQLYGETANGSLNQLSFI